MIFLPASYPRLPFFRRLHRLRIDDGGGGGLLLARFDANLLAQVVVDVRPYAFAAETAIVVMHRAPRRQIVRQHSPGATGAVEIEDAVDHFAHDDRARTATRFLGRNVRFDQ